MDSLITKHAPIKGFGGPSPQQLLGTPRERIKESTAHNFGFSLCSEGATLNTTIKHSFSQPSNLHYDQQSCIRQRPLQRLKKKLQKLVLLLILIPAEGKLNNSLSVTKNLHKSIYHC